MARLIRLMRNSFIFSSSSSTCKLVGLGVQQQSHMSLLNPNFTTQSPRTYISQKEESAVHRNLLRFIENEIHYELEQLPLDQPDTQYNSYTVNDRPGEKWVTLNMRFQEKEDIKIEATMFDGSKHKSKLRLDDALRSHISVVITINKQGSSNSFEILCSAWSKSIKIDKLGTRKLDHSQTNPYFSPYFKELDDELIGALYVFLKERGINDDLAVFLHNYMRIKEKFENIKWMKTLKCFVENK